jgi:Protein of unknown function (DUF3164).
MNNIPEGYKEDSSGALRPVDAIKPIDLLRDELVMRIATRAEQLHAELKKFKEETLEEIAAFIELSANEYGVNIGGKKGNVQLTSYDGQYRVLRANHDAMSFDERLLAAKELIDECLRDWSGRPGVPRGLVVIADRAFRRNAAGEISVSRVLDLRSHDIDDDRWKKAMDIITDSIRVQASITYLRIQKRAGRTDQYNQLALDVAGV